MNYLTKYEECSIQLDFLRNRNKNLQTTIEDLTEQKFELHDEFIKLKEYTAKLRVQASLGPEVLEKLGHGPQKESNKGPNKTKDEILLGNVKSSDKTSGKIPLHNILKGESDGVNEVLNLLHKNKMLEQDLQSAKMELEEQKVTNEQNEARLYSLNKLQNEIKDITKKKILDTKSFKDQSERINSLVLNIKAREIELNILKQERDDVSKLKLELNQAKQVIMTHDIIPDFYDVLSKYGDTIPIQIIKSMLLKMHHKYNEHVLSLFTKVDELSQKEEHANSVSLKAQFYLKTKCAEVVKLQNTIRKYENDLKEKRNEEMLLLERIIDSSMKKYQQTPKSVKSEKTGGKTEDAKKNESLTTQRGKKKQNKPSKSPARVKPEVVDPKPVASESKTISKEDQLPEENKIKELSKPITLESHAANLQRKVYRLRTENDKLKLDLHNSNQNYLEVKDQFMALQEVFNQSLKNNSLQTSVGDQVFKDLQKEFKNTIDTLDKIESGELSIKEYDNLISDGKLKETVSKNNHLYENIEKLIRQNQVHLEQ